MKLPACAEEYVKLIVKKMRYRRKIRQDVQAELTTHFEDELKGCKTDEEKEQKAKQLITDFGDVKLLAVLLRRAKKRCRSLWRTALVRSFQALGIIVLYFLICLSPLLVGKPTISINYVDWLNELAQPNRDETDNARPCYEKAFELYVEMPQWLSKSRAKWPTDFNDVQLSSLLTWLEDNKQAIQVLRQGSRCVDYWSKYTSGEPELAQGGLVADTMEVLPSYRSLARAMRLQIRYEADNGDIETALAQPPASQAPASDARSFGEKNQTVDARPLTGRITGLVVDSQGAPVEGAKVYLFAMSEFPNPVLSNEHCSYCLPIDQDMEYRFRGMNRIFGRAHTNADGRFAMDIEPLAPDYWVPRLMIVADGLGFVCQHCDQVTGDVEVRFPKMVSIRGCLLTPDGTPAEGVMVEFARSDGHYLKSCQCIFHGPDRYLARRSLAGSVGTKTRPSRWSGSDRTLVVSRSVATEDLPEFWPRPMRTDASGSFTFKTMPYGIRVDLHLVHPDFAPARIVVDTRLSGDGSRSGPRNTLPPTFSYQLKPPQLLEGTVTAADSGEPLPGVLISVYPLDRYAGEYFTGTDEQGQYRLVPRWANGYAFDGVYPPPESGYLAAKAKHRGWPQGATNLEKDFRLDRGVIIRGRILDEQTDEPIPEASVIYRPSSANPFRKVGYQFHHPVLTDDNGRFVLTGLSGRGYLLVETADRRYIRSSDGGTAPDVRGMPVGLTQVDIPQSGELTEDVTVRLRRGRTVILQAVGPKGEDLPWVRTTWEGIDAIFDEKLQNWGQRFSEGRVVVSGLDPSRAKRVFLIHNPRRIGAVFDITPETGDGPIEVRLQPTATIRGRIITQAGKPVEDSWVQLAMSFDPSALQFTRHRGGALLYPRYCRLLQIHTQQQPPHPGGEFALECVIPGVAFGLSWCQQSPQVWDILTVDPLEPGERRNVGELIIRQKHEDVRSVFIPVAVSLCVVAALCGVYVRLRQKSGQTHR